MTLNQNTFGSLLNRGLVSYQDKSFRVTPNGKRFYEEFSSANTVRRVKELQDGLVEFTDGDFYLTDRGLQQPTDEQDRILTKVHSLPLTTYFQRRAGHGIRRVIKKSA